MAINTASLFHGKNEISISLAGIENIACIQIIYTGKMHAESMLPDDWLVTANKNRIICLSLGNSVPELLFNYIGLIKIKGASIITRDLQIYNVIIEVGGLNIWEKINSDYAFEDRLWESFSNTHFKETAIIRTSIIKNNLTAKVNELFLKDGTSYQGEYHQHNDGQAMSGSEHTDGSEPIYRKDANGRIFDTRKGANKRQAMEIMKQIEPLVPRTRKITKSDAQKIKESQKIAHKELKEEKVKRIYTENTDPSLDSYKIGGDITGEEGTAGGTGGGGSGGY